MRTSHGAADCPIASSLDLVGDAWSLLLVRDAYYGVRRFVEFQQRLGIARNVLARRLDRLVESGVLRRERYQQRPPRHEYRLTEKGRDLLPVLLALREWGERWEGGGRLRIEHASCAEDVHAVLACDACGGPLRPLDVRAHGPLVPVPARRPA